MTYNPWPALDYASFKSTSYLLHMGIQMVGKLKLNTPFEPHWSNVALWLTARGLTTGVIPYQGGAFTIELDLIHHQVMIITSWGLNDNFQLDSMSVENFNTQLFTILQKFKIMLTINTMPQEIAHPLAFEKDTLSQTYNKELANAWWRILLSSYSVMKRYHSHFNGETPPIGLMWGTFDLRDARYNGVPVATTGTNAGYIRRNAMNEAQVEIGWWPGNEAYPRPAYFSFTYPQPKGIETAKINPEKAHWDATLMEFILDYDNLRQSKYPEKDLLNFFESAYKAGTRLAGWNKTLITSGDPV